MYMRYILTMNLNKSTSYSNILKLGFEIYKILITYKELNCEKFIWKIEQITN